ncbi:flagellar motor protein MotB [Cystobacter fuscus]|uniref:flagellar motor protein MotB n=1 Tax=Cystobacter fuscus TaxID=43 RepID=UPI0037C0A574
MGLADPLLFAPRGTALTPEGTALLTRVGAKLAVEGHILQVAVYTDTLPESSPSSWELSAARAVTVTRLLAETLKLPPERLVAMSHVLPPAPAWTEQGSGMELTRRLELRLVPAPRAPGHDRPRG